MITLKQNYFLPNSNLSEQNKTTTLHDSHNIIFQGKITKPIKISVDELSKLKQIVVDYEDIMQSINHLNAGCVFKKQDAYPHLMNLSKSHGLIFDLLQFFNDKSIQVFINKLKKNELISFGIIDKLDNSTLVQYQVNKNEQANIVGDDKFIPKFSDNPFETKDGNKFANIIDYFVTEFSFLKFYFRNFHTVKKMLSSDYTLDDVHKIIENLKDGVSVKLKPEINNIKKEYDELIDLLQQMDKDTGILKREYLGDLYAFVPKGTSFKLPNEENKVLNYFPINTKRDSRIFRLEIYNKIDNQNEKVFIFTSDGKVMQPKIGAKADYYESINLLPLSGKEIDSFNIKMLLENLAHEINYLKTFVIESRAKNNQFIMAADRLRNQAGENIGVVKDEIEDVMNVYSELIKKFKNLKASKQLKENYMQNMPKKQKIMFYRFPYQQNGGYMDFHPVPCRYDDRLFRLSIKDNKGDLENVFIFGQNGHVYSQKILSDDISYSYAWNLIALSDYQMKKSGIKNLLAELKNEILKFDDYVSAYRLKHSAHGRKKSDVPKDNNLVKNNKDKTKSDSISSENITQENVIPDGSDINKLKSKKTKTKVKATKTKEAKKENPKVAPKAQNVKPKQPKSKRVCTYKRYFDNYGSVSDITDMPKPEQNISLTSNTEKVDLSKVHQYLNSIFALPVEERNKDFKHKKLNDGRLFSAQFETKTKSGVPVTVSKIKSPNYVDFIYYSIKFLHHNKTIVANIDPETGNLLKSEHGIAKVRKSYVQYMNIKDFVEENKISIEELTEVIEALVK